MEQLLDELYGIKPNKEALTARTYCPMTITELRLQAIQDVGLSTLMEEALVLVTNKLGVEYGKIFELQSDGESLLLRSGKGLKEGFVGQATVPLDSPAGYTLASKEPTILEDVYSETRFNVPPLLHEHGVKSSVLVTICNQEQQPLGVLGADTTEQRAFTEDDADFLQAVAEVLALMR
jgi:GAF domain-containing protein